MSEESERREREKKAEYVNRIRGIVRNPQRSSLHLSVSLSSCKEDELKGLKEINKRLPKCQVSQTAFDLIQYLSHLLFSTPLSPSLQSLHNNNNKNNDNYEHVLLSSPPLNNEEKSDKARGKEEKEEKDLFSSPSSIPSLSPSLSQILDNINKIRWAMELWYMLVYQYNYDQMSTTPIISTIFFNDCLFFAHSISSFLNSLPLLPLDLDEEKKQWGILKQQTTQCLILPLRQLAKSILSLQIEVQQQNMKEILNQSQSFNNIQLLTTLLKQCKHQLLLLSKSLDANLPDEVRAIVLGKVMEIIFDHLISGIQKQRDISQNESEIYNRLITSLLTDLQPLFSFDLQKISTFVPNWKKLMEISKILTMSMVGIVESYESRLLSDFSAEEIRSLILALFTDTPYRSSLLLRVK